MKVIENLEVRNYRGIRGISFKPNSINILVGRNNTGKSAILEAITFVLSSHNKFRDSIGNNLLEYITEIREYNESYLVYINGKTAEIKAKIEDKEYTITVEYYSEGLPQDERLNHIIEYFENLINELYYIYIEEEGKYVEHIINNVLTTFLTEFENKNLKLKSSDLKILKSDIRNKLLRKKAIGSLKMRYKESEIQTEDLLEELRSQVQTQVHNLSKLIITAYKNSKIAGLYINFVEPIRIRKIGEFKLSPRLRFIESRKNEIIPFKNDLKHIPLLFDFERVTYASSIEDLHDSVVEIGKIRRAIELLKERNIIEDIRKTEKGLMVFPKQYEEPLPLSSMGDGFIALLKIIFLIAIAEKGVILIEEPEVSLHPGYLDVIVEEIVSNSNRVQFFISTHSFDLIQSLLKKADDHRMLDKINVIRLHYREAAKQIYTEILDGSKAKEEIDEIGTDLRQT